MTEHTELKIRNRAYALWQEHGCEPGKDMDFWLQAEREILDFAPSAAPEPAAKPKAPAKAAAKPKAPAKAAAKPKAPAKAKTPAK
ncbi:DUF2934 domain-containing protein [Oleispirillum naphthae]|uniref:DUF2934 domain-containing protein n=1 Tax=Oleispirillum naphthae TaxID=2838853 RepID=UPI00308259BF